MSDVLAWVPVLGGWILLAWLVCDWQTNYAFKPFDQFLKQEYVWWIQSAAERLSDAHAGGV